MPDIMMWIVVLACVVAAALLVLAIAAVIRYLLAPCSLCSEKLHHKH